MLLLNGWAKSQNSKLDSPPRLEVGTSGNTTTARRRSSVSSREEAIVQKTNELLLLKKETTSQRLRLWTSDQDSTLAYCVAACFQENKSPLGRWDRIATKFCNICTTPRSPNQCENNWKAVFPSKIDLSVL
eukprot:GHVP01025637.1.p1 GENE.GHVP01025637.1~~GHVP01025637.1.p1  ORF type:complete len:131 (-),score=24.66 GHVP01025637.1:109-501(-)